MKKTITFCFSLVLGFAYAQNYWQKTYNFKNAENAQISARNAQYLNLNIQEFKQQIFNSPLFQNNELSPTIINIPLPNGNFEEYMVYESPVMEQGLAVKYPEIKTFLVQSVENRLNTGRVDLTPKGFHALINTNNGTLYIDPFFANDNTKYISYYKRYFYTDKQKPTCAFENNENDNIQDNIIEDLSGNHELPSFKNIKTTNGNRLRTYRIAVSATAEYTQFHGGTVTDGLAAVVTSINRINVVYEKDLSIHLNLIANNDLIIYTNASTDPFSNPTDAGQNLDDNETSLTSTIGDANYDIGHVVGRSGSGLAGFGVVCVDNGWWSHKAQGTTGISNPIGDPFDIDYLAHEIGHQFGGSHTFNGNNGSCNGNREGNSAYEPGSGTTIMAYAGICGSDNTQNNSDDYFHARSLNQIINYTTQDNGDDCPVKTLTNNSIPQVQSLTPTGLNIPISTPFELEAFATDNDGDAVTYCWEQYDLGSAGSPNNPSGNAPLFRSFSPTENPIRTFPQLTDILNNTQTIGEILPDYQRSMNFRVTARDNKLNHGAINDDNIAVNVVSTAGPFVVTSQNTNGIVWTASSYYNVTWDVANTTASPISCNTVDIYLSIDGGQTFSIQLADDVANSGVYAVEAPQVVTTDARIKVKASNNIFFDINNSNFEIQADCASIDASIDFNDNLKNAFWCEGATGTLSFSASSNLAVNSFQWYKNGVAISGATFEKFIKNNVQISDFGDYYCEVSNGCETAITATANVQVTSNPIVPIITENGGVLQSSVPYGIQWYVNDIAINGATNEFFTPTQEGVYTVKSIAGNCSATSASFTTGINDLNSVADISIYPNPSTGKFYVSINNWHKKISYEVVDILGKTIVENMANTNQFDISLENYTAGVYLLKLKSDTYQSTYKLIKRD